MAYPITITLQVAQDVADFVKTDETADVELRSQADSYASQYVVGTHLGSGVYSFVVGLAGVYKVYDTSGGTVLASFGEIPIGELGAVLTTGTQTIGGAKTFSDVITFSSQAVFSAGLKTNTIVANSGTAVSISGISLDTNLTTSNIVNLNGTQTITAVKTFSALPESSVAPTTANQFTNKTYVDGQIAAVNALPYQQGSNIRRVIYGGTVQAGKVYSSIEDCLENIGTTSATDRYIVELEKGQADSTYSNIFPLSHSAITSLTPAYVTIRGNSRLDTHLLFGLAGDTATLTSANLIFENMSIYLSATDLTGARIYNSVNFIDCDIYAYENLTLASTKVIGCKVWSTTSKTVTISGIGEWLGSYFSASVTESGSVYYTAYTDSLDSTPTMPTVPDLGS